MRLFQGEQRLAAAAAFDQAGQARQSQDPVSVVFVDADLGLQQFLKQARIDVIRHVTGLFWKWRVDPGSDAKALSQPGRPPRCPLPRCLAAGRVGEPTALPAQEPVAREVQLPHVPAAATSTSTRTDEIGAAATVPARAA